MSQELIVIKGRKEVVNEEAVSYKDQELCITSFYGGTSNGAMIQLDIDMAHIQLDKNKVRDLVYQLNQWLI